MDKIRDKMEGKPPEESAPEGGPLYKLYLWSTGQGKYDKGKVINLVRAGALSIALGIPGAGALILLDLALTDDEPGTHFVRPDVPDVTDQWLPKDILPVLGEAPYFEAETADGDNITLDDYRGKVVVLDFWASWCGPCKAKLPMINRISNKYRDKGLVMIGVSLDKNADRMEDVIDEYGLDFDNIRCPEGSKILSDYDVHGIPHVAIIDRNGKLRQYGSEYLGWRIEQLLKE